MMHHKKFFIHCARIVVCIFALIGFVTTSVFFAMQFGLLNVRGSMSARNAFFEHARSEAGLSTTSGTASWEKTNEWQTVSAGLAKDHVVIERVARETNVPARLIAAVAVPEQLRFFTASRDVYKSYFEPFKLLGTLSQFSLGVTGIKPETAERIEMYAHDPASTFFPGEKAASLLTKSNPETRFARLTDEEDHYFQYLYTALFIAEITAQWEHAGYTDVLKPGIIVTLFNIGFDHSKPNSKPQLGGAIIKINGQSYTYGELGALFYESNELSFF